MPFADSNATFQPDADLRFGALIGKPTVAIALTTAVVLTAITWITTFLVTVSSVAAYLTQNVALASAQEPAWNIASLVSGARNVSAPLALPQTDSWPQESAPRSARAPHIVIADPGLKTPALRETLVEESTSAMPVVAQIIEPRVEGVTTQLSRVTQDPHPLTSVITQSRAAATAAAHPAPAQEPCTDAFWSGICRERMRWAYCHPDKWDTVAECVVQKFDVSYSVN
jgi:hypothetical protein